MTALESKGTWELIDPLLEIDIVGFKWVFTMKYNSDGSVEMKGINPDWWQRDVFKLMVLISF